MMRINKYAIALIYLHPLLFTCFVPLFLYAHNIQSAWPSDLPLVLKIAFGTTALLFLAALAVCRSRVAPSLLLVTYVLVIFALYPFVTDNKALLMKDGFYICLGMVCLFLIVRCRYFRIYPIEHVFWFIFGLILVSYNAAVIVINDRKQYLSYAAEIIRPHFPKKIEKNRLPHIIYIVPDRYPSKEVLASAFQFDNSAFLSELAQRHFYVQDTSFANYTKTFQSLASTFNMQYINFVSEEFGTTFSSFRPVYYLLAHNQGFQLLKTAGYNVVNMANWWEGTRKSPIADDNFSDTNPLAVFTEFQKLYLENHPILRLFSEYFRQKSYIMDCGLIPSQEQKLFDIMRRDEPQFVFWHMALPHPPFIFDRTGKCLDKPIPDDQAWEDHRVGFIGQLEFSNQLLLRMFDRISAESERDFIFVIQSDEGPFPLSYIKNHLIDWFTMSPDDIRIKYGTINAIFFKSGKYGPLHGQITPINNFRLVLNEVFGTGLPLLTHQSFVFQSEGRPYLFKDIIDLLKAPVNHALPLPE